MKITRENYPVFFLDYVEGTLSENDRKEVVRFLELNPDLKAELDGFETINLVQDENIRYPNKESLKKQAPVSAQILADASFFDYKEDRDEVVVRPGYYEFAFAAYVEGDLSEQERKAVELFAASSPQYRREFDRMQKARFSPQDEPVYPEKQHLKKFIIGTAPSGQKTPVTARKRKGAVIIPILTAPVRKRLLQVASVAAAIIFLAVLTFTLSLPEQRPGIAAYESDQPETIHPVDVEPGQPGAVVEAPAPQQETESFSAEKPIEPVRPHGVQPSRRELLTPEQRHIAQAELQYQDEFTGRPVRSLQLARAEMIRLQRPVPIQTRKDDYPQQMEHRDEFYWLAFVTPTPPDPVSDPPTASAQRQEVSLGQFAMGQIQERTGIDLGPIDNLLAADASNVRSLAGRGLAGLNNLLGSPVVVDGETTAEGRKVQFAVGNFFEVSRSGSGN